MSSRVARAGGLLFAGWCSIVSAQQTALPAQETPAELLTRMSNSVHYLDYEGSIVYLREGVMDGSDSPIPNRTGMKGSISSPSRAPLTR